MKYYNAKQIAEITGYGIKSAYKVIAKLNEQLEKDYPNQIIFSAKIPIWYWEEKTEPKRGETSNEIKAMD